MSDLESLSLPEGLKALSVSELELFAEEIRQKIISVCLKNGGHIGASLGTVEIAIALHRIFNSPKDQIIWDVGHQAYAHKLLTGRLERFDTLRKANGISGFLSREESPHDIFGAGHASTSISAALGVSSVSKEWTIAVIGDGGMTAGLAFEALNNVKSTPRAGPLMILLNDNQMSISENVGAIHEILNCGNAAEFFSFFDLDYVGPVSGHDIGQLSAVLNGIKSSKPTKPVLLHVLTQKGKGYGPAETRPEKFHGIGPMKMAVDKTEPIFSTPEKTWSECFCEKLISLAENNEKIHVVTAAMMDGTGLLPFQKKFPERVHDVGIAEAHAVTYAAGLATQGKTPVVAIYSTFLQRGLDGMIHDVALQGLPVIFAVDRAGTVGADGPTHHGVFDLAYSRMIPGFQVFAPESIEDLEYAFDLALKTQGPSLIRYPRGAAHRRDTPGKSFYVSGNIKNPSQAIVSIGEVGRRIRPKENAIHFHVIQAKPTPTEIFNLIPTDSVKQISFFEEGVKSGGFGEEYLEQIAEKMPEFFKKIDRVQNFGYPDSFIPHGALADIEKWLNERMPGRAEFFQ